MTKIAAKSMAGKKVAILVANGFTEQDLTEAQRALIEAGATTRMISPDNGLVNGWSGAAWGHHYAVDATLSTALGADYDALVIPGGQRSLDKLKLTAHTKRFISSFLNAQKPVATFGDALHLIVFTDNIKDRAVAGPVTLKDVATQAGGQWQDAPVYADGPLLTGRADEETRRDMVAAMIVLFASGAALRQAA